MPAAGIRSLQPNEINTVISACVGLGNGVLLRHNAHETQREDAGSNWTLESLVGQCLDRVVTAYLEQTCKYIMSVNWSLGRYLCQVKNTFWELRFAIYSWRVCVCGNVIELSFVNRHCAVDVDIQMYVYRRDLMKNVKKCSGHFSNENKSIFS